MVDPDIGVGRSRQEAMEAARKKQQEKLNQSTALHAEIEQEVRLYFCYEMLS